MGGHERLTEQVAGASKGQRGIHAMEVGGRILCELADAGQPMSMAALSVATNIPLNQVFTYLVSLTRTGLVRRDAVTHRFEPGPLSLTLGLHALVQLSPLRETFRRTSELAKATRYGVLVAVWDNSGPTVIQYINPEIALHTGMHVGAVMSMAHTSTGRTFAAFMPKATVERMLLSDIRQRHGAMSCPTLEEFEQLLVDIRENGVSRTEGLPIPGISSLSVPVFNRTDQIVLAITIFGETGVLDVARDGVPMRGLMTLAGELSTEKI
ncbi:IclR family transcriptional regulator C-terminal domain-containing protein [Paraburkholderia nemoris]|uniref:IclR family transcriptional regulator n=1 Tax=Paraburkholderia nemoris TaxID=2793076 RepID=UPI0038BB6E45